MTILVNGKPESQTPAADRGLLYGQSVFETIAVSNSRALLLDRHLQRLKLGCDRLQIPCDNSLIETLANEIEQLSSNIKTNAVIRATVTMGEGGRGYLNPQSPKPNRIVAVHKFPDHPPENRSKGIELGLASIRLSSQPRLAGIKHGNRLEQAIARSEWQPNWQEALLMDQQDRVIEGTQSNLFVLAEDLLLTPSLEECGVQGIIRDYLLENAAKIGLKTEVRSLLLDEIEQADEVFMTNSLIGLWPVRKFRQQRYAEPKYAPRILRQLLENEAIPNY